MISDDRSLTNSLSVVIPTFNRGGVLIDTISYFLNQSVSPDEIIVVDQTDYIDADQIAARLAELARDSKIQWVRKEHPSIPMAMNEGLLIAKSDWVLFIDDDVNINDSFVERHKQVISQSASLAHVGQIVQPWQEPNFEGSYVNEEKGLSADLLFPFNYFRSARINNCMAGNLCVNRQAAIKSGGFDENFYGVAYRFETEFCKRFCKVHDVLFLYSPKPVLNHLYIKSGGTRAHADFLTSSSPVHSMGDYYFALLHGGKAEACRYIVQRFFGCVVAKFYLYRPWYMPTRIVAEFRGLLSALFAYRRGQKLIDGSLVASGKKSNAN